MKSLVLPYPPSTNRLWRNAGGRMILSKEAEAFKRTVYVLAKQARVTLVDGPVSLSLVLHPPTLDKLGRKAGVGIDLSNSIKAAEDALQGVAYANDKQVVEISARRGEPVPGGKLVVSWAPTPASD